MKVVVATLLVIAAWVNIAIAQVCNGSLGDPILNETFGEGHYVLPLYKSSYDYSGGCPSPGTYTTTGFIFGCGPHTWVKITGDHTGDHNGNCMLVNAENAPGTIYTDTLKNLCGNTVYQFGAWVTSVMTSLACGGNALLPNIKFQIKSLSGTMLALDSTGYLPLVDDKNWQFYKFSFLLPPNISDAILAITINPAKGCGSAFALDDITVRPCGTSITATIDGSPGPADVCADYTNPFVMQAAYAPGFSNPALQWQTSVDSGKTWVDIAGQTSLSYAVPRRLSGEVLYRVGIAESSNIGSVRCRINSNVISTSVHPVPLHAAPQYLTGCTGKDFLLPSADPSALASLWSGPGGYQSTKSAAVIPQLKYSDTGLYTFKESFYFNCVSLDTFYLKIFPGTALNAVPGYPICAGASEQLSAVSSGNVRYQWFPSTGLSNDTIPNPVAMPGDSTDYKVVSTNEYGCKDSATIQVFVYQNPKANAGPDVSLLRGDTVQLKATAAGTAVSIQWSPTLYMINGQSVSPLVHPPVDTKYTLTVSSTVGCGSVSSQVAVKVYNDIFVPNAFTPNGDGTNDYFQVTPFGNYKLVRLALYNRWGKAVFVTEGSYAGWDGNINGNPQPPGVYVYTLQMLSPTGKLVTKQGTVLLVR